MNKTVSFILTGLPILVSPSSAQSIFYDFEGEDLRDIFADDEVAGWTQDIPNPPIIFGQESPIAFINSDKIITGPGGQFDGYFFGTTENKAAYLGNLQGNQIDPNSTSVMTTFDTAGLTGSIPQVRVDLGIVDYANNFFEGRASFQFKVMGDSGTELALIEFQQSLVNEGDWEIGVSSNGGSTTIATDLLTPQTGYTFTIDFETFGTVFSYEEAVAGTPALIDVQPPVTNYASRVDGITLTHVPGVRNDDDATSLVFDDVTVSVPELSSSLFAGLGLIFLAYRQRS